MTKKQAREEVRRRFGAAFDVDKTPHEKPFAVMKRFHSSDDGYDFSLILGRGSSWEEAIEAAATQ